MKQFKLFLCIIIILSLSLRIIAQSGGNGPERFYNVESYKADIKLTFNYRLALSVENSSRTVRASQSFHHDFITASGERTISDMFQMARGDKSKDETDKGGILGGINMDSIAQALKNSGVDPSVLDMLEKTKKETQTYQLDFEKYKIWMANLVAGGVVSTSIYTKFSQKSSGIIHCGEGQGDGRFFFRNNYTGSANTLPGKPDINNPNGFALQLNLNNNTYSFSADIKMPPGFQFLGTHNELTCGRRRDGTYGRPLEESILINAESFINNRKEKEGLIYKRPLPESGVILTGSDNITDIFDIRGIVYEYSDRSIEEGQGTWSVIISWTIYPADMEVPEVFISYENEETGKKWIPEDKNSVEAKMTWGEQIKPEAIEWTLYNVSAEPGTNLNSKDRDGNYDLSFDLAEVSAGYRLTRTDDGYVAYKEGGISVGKESILIQSLDFGSYGQLSGKIKVNGTWWEAKHEELGIAWLPVPWDENNNMIADEWENQIGIYGKNYPPTWDEDPEPASQFSIGDGFTLYEEYRGFTETGNLLSNAANVQVKKQHVRLDPEYKDVFIYDKDNLFKNHYAPTNAANLNWHYITFDLMQKKGTLEANPDYRCVNFNTSKEFYSRDQYALYLVNDGLNPDPNWPNDAGVNNTHATYSSVKNYRAAFPLQAVYKVSIFPTGIDNALVGLPTPLKGRVKGEMLTTTVIHEIGHALGTRHHWDAAASKTDSNSITFGVLNCAMRYETDTESGHAPTHNFLKTRYCTKGETWIMPGKGTTFTGHDCYGQIDIKGN